MDEWMNGCMDVWMELLGRGWIMWEEQWNKRLNDNKGQRDQVLILKSEFNTAWDYFNASELGKTIIEFWHN
jgi:hypothetical protein